jgi:hypothetical protein
MIAKLYRATFLSLWMRFHDVYTRGTIWSKNNQYSPKNPQNVRVGAWLVLAVLIIAHLLLGAGLIFLYVVFIVMTGFYGLFLTLLVLVGYFLKYAWKAFKFSAKTTKAG